MLFEGRVILKSREIAQSSRHFPNETLIQQEKKNQLTQITNKMLLGIKKCLNN